MGRRRAVFILIATLGSSACAAYSDPRVQAARDFRSTVFDVIGEDEAQTKRLNGLRLGMSAEDVLGAAGTPARRESRVTESGRSIETWVYEGQLATLGTLTFENGNLVQVTTN
jgi:hypothetical protein